MALLRIEALAQRWLLRGSVPFRERLLASMPRWAPWLARLGWLIDLRERFGPVARLCEQWLGISGRRSLPRAAPRSFLAGAALEPVGDDQGRAVVLLVDTFSNHFEPATAQAALDVLVAAGYRVHIARAGAGERPLCCGRTYLSHGMVAEARAEAQRVIDALAPYTGQGLPIIGLEPSCLLMLRDEYYALGLGPKTAEIAKSALLLEEFLAREHDGGRLSLPLQPIESGRALVHGHCHQKAFGAMKAMRKVLGLVPGLEVELIESSCCGMAGAFGLEAEHYEVSMQMAELSLLPELRRAPAETLVIANGTSCRHQIRDGVQRESRHLARVLQAALANPLPQESVSLGQKVL
jgi:Fe-S oxidoreductase